MIHVFDFVRREKASKRGKDQKKKNIYIADTTARADVNTHVTPPLYICSSHYIYAV